MRGLPLHSTTPAVYSRVSRNYPDVKFQPHVLAQRIFQFGAFEDEAIQQAIQSHPWEVIVFLSSPPITTPGEAM